EERAQADDLDPRAARHVGHADPDVGPDREAQRAGDAAERLPGAVDAGRIEVGAAVAVDVDPGLDLAHELHEVGDGLAQALGAAAQRAGAHRADALGAVDPAVAVLVDAAAARRDRDGLG